MPAKLLGIRIVNQFVDKPIRDLSELNDLMSLKKLLLFRQGLSLYLKPNETFELMIG
ncbi:MAG: hypothetical protein ACTSYR_00140 [Candidatus Odinarchaeia archaeon]